MRIGDLKLRMDGRAIGWLTLGCFGAGNLLSSSVCAALDGVLDLVEERARLGSLKALVLRGSKSGTFSAGADLAELIVFSDPAEGAEWARRGQQTLRRLEQLPVPTIAAIEGVCTGAGAELALACGYRIGSASSRARIGLPQMRWGTLPAWGGTVRLPRLLGLKAALEMILTGSVVNSRTAHQLGLLDEVFTEDRFDAQLRRFVDERIRRGRTRTGARRGVARRLVEDTAPGRRLVYRQAAKWLRSAAARHHPDAPRVVATVAEGLALPLETAFAREATTFGDLVVAPQARGFLHIASLRQAAAGARTVHSDAAAAKPATVTEAAILGAGPLGTRIAHLMALHGIPVRLKAQRQEGLSRGLRQARHLLDAEVERGSLHADDAADRRNLLSGKLGFGRFGTVDLVVEAVEDRAGSTAAHLAGVAEHVRDDCLLASTSGLVPIAPLQHRIAHPGRVLGMHFLPVPHVALVELVRGPLTSYATLAAASALVRRLGKTPIVVADLPGLVAFRLLAPYLHEAVTLVREGTAVEEVDAALREFGMALGPLRLLDELGIDAAADWLRMLAGSAGEHLMPPPLLLELVDAGRVGVKAGRGFYRYSAGRARQPKGDINDLVSELPPAERASPSREEIRRRVVLAMINEAARIAADGVVDSLGDVDLGSVLGAGFPAWRGGILFYAAHLGFARVRKQLDELARTHGERFAPAALLYRTDAADSASSGQSAARALE